MVNQCNEIKPRDKSLKQHNYYNYQLHDNLIIIKRVSRFKLIE